MDKLEYAQVPSTDGNSSCDDLLESRTDPSEKTQQRRLRLKLLFAFLIGLFAGVVATVILQPLIRSDTATISPPTSKNSVEHKHPMILPTTNSQNSYDESPPPSHHHGKPKSYDVNADRGFVINPKTGEAKCGNNWQEAKKLGCHYDVLASRWYSDECFNGEVLETMLKEVDFKWYADEQHTQPVSWDLAKSGEFERLWPLHDYHIMHCLYLWRRLHSALVGHLYLDDDVYSYHHTLHCTRLIMQWPMEWKYGKNTTTVSPSGRPFCRNEPL